MAQKKPEGLIAELGVEDLYGFLGVEPTSSEKEITSEYRRKARKCHPDKNPDDPNAANIFLKLSKIYTILTDPAAKAAYDKWLKAKHAAKMREKALDSKRRKLKKDLESKESQHLDNLAAEMDARQQLEKVIERLREEGHQRMKEQEEQLRGQFLLKTEDGDSEDSMLTLKVTWRARKTDESNGGYSQQVLEDIFAEFGSMHHVLVSAKKKGKALVTFDWPEDAQHAVERATGLAGNPLTVSWLSGQPAAAASPAPRQTGASVGHVTTGSTPLHDNKDYESITLMRLRQAEERKRLSEQLAQEEEEVT